MQKAPPLKPGQRALLELLRRNPGKTITSSEILAVTKWKPTTLRVYARSGALAGYLAPAGQDSFLVAVRDSYEEWDFHRAVSQSPQQRRTGSPCKNPLARALVEKAKDNIILALELYNRPSLANRLDAFAMLFTTAWEQLLKAEVIEKYSEDKIYRQPKPGRRRETIGLSDCVDLLFQDQDPIAKNIKKIEELRHGATHLMMPPVQASLSKMFQAGVINFAVRFKSFAAEPLLPVSSVGLLSIVAGDGKVSVADLRQLYGQVAASDISNLVQEIDAAIEATGSEKFAVTVEYRLALTKTPKDGDISLSSAVDAPQKGVIVIKPMSVDNTHPYRSKDVTREVMRVTAKPFNSTDFQAVAFYEKWKKSNNEYHHLQKNPDTPKYSQKVVDHICAKTRESDHYLMTARQAYKHEQKRRRDPKKRRRS